MTTQQKITERHDWYMVASGRVAIIGATYRKALSYLCYLRYRYGRGDFVAKPILIK